MCFHFSRYGRYDEKTPGSRNRTPSPIKSPNSLSPVKYPTGLQSPTYSNGANKVIVKVSEWNGRSPEPQRRDFSLYEISNKFC